MRPCIAASRCACCHAESGAWTGHRPRMRVTCHRCSRPKPKVPAAQRQDGTRCLPNLHTTATHRSSTWGGLVRCWSKTLSPDPNSPTGRAARIKRGVAKDRMPSLGDREMRHGRKSKSKLFNGYKRHILKVLGARYHGSRRGATGQPARARGDGGTDGASRGAWTAARGAHRPRVPGKPHASPSCKLEVPRFAVSHGVAPTPAALPKTASTSSLPTNAWCARQAFRHRFRIPTAYDSPPLAARRAPCTRSAPLPSSAVP
jgi:hypothetical protein